MEVLQKSAIITGVIQFKVISGASPSNYPLPGFVSDATFAWF
jgi:hypothetical protein